MSGGRIALAAGLVLATAAPAAGQEASGTWPIKRFEVATVAPWRDVAIDFDDDGEPDLAGGGTWLVPWMRRLGLDPDAASDVTVELRPETRRAIESHLRRSAEVLEGWGFPPPALEPEVESGGAPAYRVYVVAGLKGASGEYHTNVCQDDWRVDEAIILLDADDVLDGSGQVTPRGLQTVGHELFHAVQYATPFFRKGRCDVGDWITEGQATAVGWDLVRSVHMLDPGDVDGEDLWSHRDYARRLPVALRLPASERSPFGSDPAYRTASFWRYLAELDHSRKPGGPSSPPGPGTTGFEYRYLANLLRRPAAAYDCRERDAECDAELHWLNAGLLAYDRFKVGLRRLYPAFATTFAAYGEHRFAPHEPDLTPDEAGLIWERAFDACYLLEPTPDRRHVTDRYKLEDVAAGCFTVQPSGFGGEVNVDVQVNAIDETRLSQLTLGIAGGQRLATPTVRGVDGNGRARARWTFRLPDGERTRMVLSNVAEAPEDTWPQTVYVTVTVPGQEHTAQAPPDDEPAAEPAPEAADPGPAGTEEAVRERVQRALTRVTANGRRTADIRRNEGRGELIIRLAVEPDIVNVIDPEVQHGRGGVAGQAVATGMAAMELMQNLDALAASAKEARDREGARIELTVPLVDYGFRGTFDDAEITFSRPDDGPLRAIPPDGGRPNGTVTIEVYEPEILSGTFSADLVDRYTPRPRKVERSVSGSFWVSSPWEEDDRMDVDLSPVARRDIQYDILQMVPGSMTEMVRERMESAPDAGDDLTGDPAGGGAARAVRTPDCECTCELWDRYKAMIEDLARAPRPQTPEEEALAECVRACMPKLVVCESGGR